MDVPLSLAVKHQAVRPTPVVQHGCVGASPHLRSRVQPQAVDCIRQDGVDRRHPLGAVPQMNVAPMSTYLRLPWLFQCRLPSAVSMCCMVACLENCNLQCIVANCRVARAQTKYLHSMQVVWP